MFQDRRRQQRRHGRSTSSSSGGGVVRLLRRRQQELSWFLTATRLLLPHRLLLVLLHVSSLCHGFFLGGVIGRAAACGGAFCPTTTTTTRNTAAMNSNVFGTTAALPWQSQQQSLASSSSRCWRRSHHHYRVVSFGSSRSSSNEQELSAAVNGNVTTTTTTTTTTMTRSSSSSSSSSSSGSGSARPSFAAGAAEPTAAAEAEASEAQQTAATTTAAAAAVVVDDRERENNENNNKSSDNKSSDGSVSTFAVGDGEIDVDSVLGVDPENVRIVTISEPRAETEPPSDDLIRRLPFVSMFRGSANYIATHRNTLAVYHIPGSMLATGSDLTAGGKEEEEEVDAAAAAVNGGSSEMHVDGVVGDNNKNNNKNNKNKDLTGLFRDIMNDVALTWLLGMKIVLVVGCRHQIEQRLNEQRKQSQVQKHAVQHGLRVTDKKTLRIVKEEAGYVRFEVERQLARSIRLLSSGGTGTGTSSAAAASASVVPKTTTRLRPNGGGGGMSSSSNSRRRHLGNSKAAAYMDGNVVSGNFYSAQPFGILDGIDYQYTGFVRRIEVDKIKQLHAARDICLMTTLGVSPSGEVFNVCSESLAAAAAAALAASKVVYFNNAVMELRHAAYGKKIPSLRLSDARKLLRYMGVQMHKKGYVTVDEKKLQERLLLDNDAAVDMLLKIGWSTLAVEGGVRRAHVISPKHGAVLQELYTRDGSGTLISGDLYEGIRQATERDVNSIHELIAPLVRAGTLVDRPVAVLEKDIGTYYVFTRDEHVVACGQFKPYEDGYAEIGCLVVNPEYRARGRGDAMLGYLERLCVVHGKWRIFVLSTQTMEWFVERGFAEVHVDQLPASRRATYNYSRNSKIYLKQIENVRDLDASELRWNR